MTCKLIAENLYVDVPFDDSDKNAPKVDAPNDAIVTRQDDTGEDDLEYARRWA
jgi:hypothetical protein